MSARSDQRLDALLVGYDNQENLGLRSIIAYLDQLGYRVSLLPFLPGHEEIIHRALRKQRPRLIGFSIIFQINLMEFGDLMKNLRASSIQAHFTAGGHFPSLCPEETLTLIPELDSIVRFEGEETLAELIDHLDQPDRWEHVRGLAFRRENEIVVNASRPLIQDLDRLPVVHRDTPRQAGLGIKMAYMAASRGCLHNCSFCSIRKFYGSTSGALRRTRSPHSVVAEMQTLFTEKDVRFFSFQDDDFAAKTRRQRRWLDAFLEALRESGLSELVRWKISCRVDDLEPQILQTMLTHGLMAVYIGVESGSEKGLQTLNKQVSVAQNRNAIELLKAHRLAMAMGFMLFDPSSTIDTLYENLAFLHAVGEDGYFPINFCKMIPYASTPIEASLRKAGRLKGTITRPNYTYLDPRLDSFELLVNEIFSQRNHDRDGILAKLELAHFTYHLVHAFNSESVLGFNWPMLQELTRRFNRLALQTVSTLLDELICRGVDDLLEDPDAMVAIAGRQWRGDKEIEMQLHGYVNQSVAPNWPRQPWLLAQTA